MFRSGSGPAGAVIVTGKVHTWPGERVPHPAAFAWSVRSPRPAQPTPTSVIDSRLSAGLSSLEVLVIVNV